MATLVEPIAAASPEERLREDILRPLRGLSVKYVLTLGVFLAIVAWAMFAWSYQIANGMGVAGIRRPVYWGLYIVNFVFWIGISHAGTLISAILRLTDAGWRKPVTRAAEAITVFCLIIGGMFPLIHLGRVSLFYWLIPYPNERLLWPNFRSPLVWDMVAIFTYLIGSVLYLYLPLIPDLALIAQRTTGWRSSVYRFLSLNWTGAARQWQALERAMKLMAGMILAVAVSVHSVVAFDFSLTIAPMWHSTIFPPYFVVGAIFSGIAALVLVMAALRHFLHLEEYLRPLQFDNLGKLLLLMSLMWFYFSVAEHLTTWYGNSPAEIAVFNAREHGVFAPALWLMVTCNFLIPFVLLSIRRLRNITTVCIASVTILVGMWIERFLIVVPTLSHTPLPAAWGEYAPTWVELSITAGTFAGMAALYLIFVKLFPIIAIWEYEDDH